MNSCIFVLSSVVLLTGSEAAFLSLPRNQIALKNESVEFQCSTDSVTKSLRWHVIYAGSKESFAIIARRNSSSAGELRYSIDTSGRGQCTLTMKAVTMSYAGKYMCSEGFAGPEVEAELAVVDAQPLCLANASDIYNALVENDYLWMMCSLSFSGNLNLTMTWVRNITGSVIAYNTTNSRNQSMIVIPVTSSDNGETFTFKATFRQENNSHETVVTWNFTVKVFYTPRNLVIKPYGDVYQVHVGDSLECSADGNPTPSYEWTDILTKRTINDSVLTIDEDMKPGQNHTFRCTAYNTVNRLGKDVQLDEVTFRLAGITTTPSGSSAAIIGSAVTVTLLSIVIVIVVLFCRRVNVKVKSKRREDVLAEIRHSDQNNELRGEKTISKEHSQHRVQDLGNEGNYANLMDRSFNDQQYSSLHIYANSNVNTSATASASAEYANRGFIELMQLADEHFNNADIAL